MEYRIRENYNNMYRQKNLNRKDLASLLKNKDKIYIVTPKIITINPKRSEKTKSPVRKPPVSLNKQKEYEDRVKRLNQDINYFNRNNRN